MTFYSNSNEVPRDPSAIERRYDGAGATTVAVTLSIAIALGFAFLFIVPNQRSDRWQTTTQAATQPAAHPTAP